MTVLVVCTRPTVAENRAEETYSQRLTIRFRDSATAERANLKIEPLYNGHHRAVSCRWDDNWTSDNQGTRELMEKFGIRGTWYLNGRDFSPENRPADYLPVAKELLRGGNSIGGHSLTHPYITYFHSNRMFAEMSGVRIEWESALDQPVLSYAYSFVDISPGPERHDVMQRTLDSLTRSGFDHVAEYLSFFENVKMHQELSPIMPAENNPFDEFIKAVDWAYNEDKLTQNYPMITNSMHAWYGTPRLDYGYDELRKRFELLRSLKDVWHCNQNQYAGYRRQYRSATLGEIERIENTVSFTLSRPSISLLNDDTPLTLAVSGTTRDSNTSIECSGCAVVMSDRSEADLIRFHVPHRRDERLPILIGHVANPENTSTLDQLRRDQDFPQLVGGLFADGQRLTLSLRCEEGQRLEDVKVIWRAPIGYDVAPVPLKVNLRSDNSLEAHKSLNPLQKPDAHWGQEHFAAQVDFLLDGQPGRLHLTCQRAGVEPDASLPRDGFSILGPINPGAANTEDLCQIALNEWTKQCWDGKQWKLPDETDITWRASGDDGYVNQEWLNPEYVRTMGTWDTNSQTYLLRSIISCSKRQRARLTISHPRLSRVMVNGHDVVSDEVELEQGENRILVIYPGCEMGFDTQRLAACFLRLSDPETGLRLRDIQYRAF